MHNWCLEIWGDYACFTRPEMKVERVSYDIITPSAARAIFESILWKPSIRWNVTKIEVLNPIKWISVRRNEVGRTLPNPTTKHLSGESKTPLGIFIEDERQQRAGYFLRDVRYRIHGFFDFVSSETRISNLSASAEFWADHQELADIVSFGETEAKYAAMFERRAKKGQCFHRPYLGCREFACFFRLVDLDKDFLTPSIDENIDLGYMLYDMNFEQDKNNPTPLFFRAIMEKGVVNTDRKRLEVRG